MDPHDAEALVFERGSKPQGRDRRARFACGRQPDFLRFLAALAKTLRRLDFHLRARGSHAASAGEGSGRARIDHEGQDRGPGYLTDDNALRPLDTANLPLQSRPTTTTISRELSAGDPRSSRLHWRPQAQS